MFRPQKLTVWAFSLLVLPFHLAFGDEDYRLCAEAITSVVYLHQRGSLGLTRFDTPKEIFDEARASFARQHPDASFTRSTRLSPDDWYAQFTEDVLTFLISDPAEERWRQFEEKYALSREQALDILTYYASREFFNVLQALGPPRETLGRLSVVSREHRLGEPKNELARSYLYYLVNLTKLSVPQMAEQLSRARGRRISEQNVYHELMGLRLSIEDAFNQPLSPGRTRRLRGQIAERGFPQLAQNLPADSISVAAEYLVANNHLSLFTMGEIADLLGVGTRALEFILHYRRTRQHETSWARVGIFREQRMTEENILIALWHEERGAAEIADTLNQIFRSTVAQTDFRTEVAVWGKAKLLGLVNEAPLGPDLDDAEYGKLKIAGRLVPETVIPYLYDHFDLPLREVASRLEVGESTLFGFLKRHDIVRLRDSGPKLKRLLTDAEREEFRVGVLEQISQLKLGLSSNSPIAIATFARDQIKDQAALDRALIRIGALGIRPASGASARNGLSKLAQQILHEALLIIAEEKQGERPPQILSAADGTRYFGFAAPEKRAEAPGLSEELRTAFMDRETGGFYLLTQNVRGLQNDINRALDAFVAVQITDAGRREATLRKIGDLRLNKSEAHRASQGSLVAQDRVHEAILIIVEAKFGARPDVGLTPEWFTTRFGFTPRRASVAPVLPPDVLEEVSRRIFPLLKDNIRGSSQQLKVKLIEFAQREIPDAQRLAETLAKIEDLGLSDRDGGQARLMSPPATARLHEALRLIIEGKIGAADRFLTAEVLKEIFGFK